MKNPICAASYEWAVKLKAAGCPIDYLDTLPHQSFRAEQLPGYVRSCVYALGPLDTGWVIALRLTTDRPSGTVIAQWSFEPPWQDHDIDWDYEPKEIIPEKYQDDYNGLLKPRLMKVLNEGRLIRRGCPVEGLLCGRSYQPIGKSSHGVIPAKLIFTDDLGNTVPLCIDLNIDTLSYASAHRLPVGRAGGLLRRHLVESERRSVLARPIEALIAGEQAKAQMQSGSDALLETSKPESGDRAIPAGPGSESGSLRGDARTRQNS